MIEKVKQWTNSMSPARKNFIISLYSLVKKPVQITRFLNNYYQFRADSKINNRFSLLWKDRYPCLNDNCDTTPFDAHYVYHPAWAARIIATLKPEVHVDISSALHFCTILSAFVPVKFYDYRPANIMLTNLSSEYANILDLPFESESIESLSCMHTIEHIGLGRYGDPLDPDGDLKAIAELKRVLSKDGNLLFVVPIGKKSKIMFNAHRIYTYKQIREYFFDLFLVEFSLIPDTLPIKGLIINATEDDANRCSYGCGCFWFKKGVT